VPTGIFGFENSPHPIPPLEPNNSLNADLGSGIKDTEYCFEFYNAAPSADKGPTAQPVDLLLHDLATAKSTRDLSQSSHQHPTSAANTPNLQQGRPSAKRPTNCTLSHPILPSASRSPTTHPHCHRTAIYQKYLTRPSFGQGRLCLLQVLAVYPSSCHRRIKHFEQNHLKLLDFCWEELVTHWNQHSN